jgi:hypothetical protein
MPEIISSLDILSKFLCGSQHSIILFPADTYIPPEGGFVCKLLFYLHKLTSFSTPLFWGVGFCGGLGFLPKSVPLTTIVGKPISVSRHQVKVFLNLISYTKVPVI